MMKRTLLAAVMPLLLGFSVAQAAEIYNKDGNKLDLVGKINVSHLFSDDTTNDGDTSSYVRIGFKGETKITDQLTGYGFWQSQFSLRNTEGADAQAGNKTRLGYAGLKFAQFGSIDYGRNYGLIYDVLGYTDMLPFFGGDSGYVDAFLSGRSTGVLTWRNKDFFGLVKGWNVAAQYEGKNERSDSAATPNLAVRRSNGDGFALSTSYDTDFGLSAVAAYASLNRVSAQNLATYGRGEKAEHWETGVKYDANQLYLATIYGESHNATPIGNSGFANKAVNFEAVAQYQFLNGFRPSLGYVSSKGKNIENVGDAWLFKYASVGATYYFNKNMSVYSEYRINLLKDDNALRLKTDDITAVGLVYQF
ncbi:MULTISPECIES: porin [Pantoea]|uniref:Membrane protein n=1 Tax=Pantoea dispersa TaxID=59814 RepID=A0A8E1S016_9GAMM|nr:MULTISPECIES: porin [Pantoea]KTR92343.1 membrane protein [Pantoea dispersa]KTS00814.1 membrane protein [Pantoea dispersa]KTS19040.1 membrane protein [Pantoea dispersa]KTS23411.1 membrane protein [Pantoea dispersa]KTS57301.1 membrane protein [Pantoea dispersa]